MPKSKKINGLAVYRDYENGLKILNQKNMSHIIEVFHQNIQKIEMLKNKPLKLAVIGEFSVGKSAFLSKLLGREGLLPEKITPSTAFITEFYFSEKEYFEVIYENNLGDISFERVEDLNKLKDDGYKQNHKNHKNLPTINKIKVYLKNPILKHFCLLDTPGLNDTNNDMSKITQEVFEEIDYAIWIFNAMQAGSESELKELKKLHKYIGQSIYFVINKADGVAPENIKKIEKHIDSYREEFSMQDNIYAISSTSNEEKYQKYFEFLTENLKKIILDEDVELSTKKIRQEIEKLRDKIKETKTSYEIFLLEISDILQSYKNNKFDKIAKTISVEQAVIVDLIEEAITKTLGNLYKNIKDSNIYKENTGSELLQFYCYHTTLEKLTDIQNKIDAIYEEYMNKLLVKNEEFTKKIQNSLQNSIIKDPILFKDIETIVSNITSNIETSKERKILNIKGYIVGLLSDNYIYELIKSNVQDINYVMNKDVIRMLIEKDIELSFIDIKLEGLIQLVEKVKENDINELNSAYEIFKKSIIEEEEVIC